MGSGKPLLVIGAVIVVGYFVARHEQPDHQATAKGPTFAGVQMSAKDAADLGVPTHVPDTEKTTPADPAIKNIAASPSVSRCGNGGIATNEKMGVRKEAFLLDAPGAKGKKQINFKATEMLHSKQYQLIDTSTTVTELCRQDDWSEVRITEPEWLARQRGWVPSKVLRVIERDSDGTRKYVLSDLVLDDRTKPWKNVILGGINKVARENADCAKLDPATAYISSSKGSKKDPVFYVTCEGSKGFPFNVFFSASDVKSGTTLAAIKPIDQATATTMCEKAAISAATHPSTVDFSKILDLAFQKWPNGKTRLISRFTAKNSFDMKLPFDISCLFEGDNLVDVRISEAAN